MSQSESEQTYTQQSDISKSISNSNTKKSQSITSRQSQQEQIQLTQQKQYSSEEEQKSKSIQYESTESNNDLESYESSQRSSYSQSQSQESRSITQIKSHSKNKLSQVLEQSKDDSISPKKPLKKHQKIIKNIPLLNQVKKNLLNNDLINKNKQISKISQKTNIEQIKFQISELSTQVDQFICKLNSPKSQNNYIHFNNKNNQENKKNEGLNIQKQIEQVLATQKYKKQIVQKKIDNILENINISDIQQQEYSDSQSNQYQIIKKNTKNQATQVQLPYFQCRLESQQDNLNFKSKFIRQNEQNQDFKQKFERSTDIILSTLQKQTNLIQYKTKKGFCFKLDQDEKYQQILQQPKNNMQLLENQKTLNKQSINYAKNLLLQKFQR